MNEAGTLNTGLLKALFEQLVAAVGKQEAAAARLGISRQRVSQLCSANPEHARDIPTLEQVWTLEVACGRSIIFRALADAIEPPACPRAASTIKETHDIIRTVADLAPLAVAVERGEPGAVAAFMQTFSIVQREMVEAEATVRQPNVTPLRKGA